MRYRATGTGTWVWDAAKLLVLTLAAITAGLAVWQLTQVLLLLFGSVLIAVLLRGVAAPLRRFLPIGEGWSVILAALLIAAALIAFLTLIGAQFLTQARALLDTLPDLIAATENRFGLNGLGRWLEDLQVRLFSDGGIVINVASFSTNIFSLGAQLVVVVSAAIYLAINPRLYLEGFLLLVPQERQEKWRDTLETVGNALRLWLLGQLAAMALIGTVTSLGLWLLGIPSALALGVFAGLFEFVPYVGPVLSAIPAIIVGLGQGVDTALWVLLFYVVIQQAEGILITPLIQQRSVDLPPVITIFAIIAFGALFGALGVVLATPLAVVCLVLVKKLWVREVLQEDVAVPGDEEDEAAKRKEAAS
ncbi:AI-2E family transporter [Paracoccus sp. S-4012]|uniref:AI-2E family transporter n=1 Tax=Paracoccus sp. S-4012 TaxID=2665648 RepID=UPI0012AF9858|nr:AI-2E family transporter [Paracoccus sp. S-4012]MRX50734.1 AI-2E family transporter [Paracoccus sp. S-4012]